MSNAIDSLIADIISADRKARRKRDRRSPLLALVLTALLGAIAFWAVKHL